MENFDAAFYTTFGYVFGVGAALLLLIVIAAILGISTEIITTKKPNENDPR